MKVVIIGCGEVGLNVASRLRAENHDLVLIDNSEELIQSIPEELDAIHIHGNGNAINTLMEADVKHADIIIAVTGSDEVNLLCCLIAKKISTCHTIARVRNPIYIDEIPFIKEKLGVDVILNPEFATAREIMRMLLYPKAKTVETFSRNRVTLANGTVTEESGMSGTAISKLGKKLGGDLLIGAVERSDQVVIPNGDFVLENGDDIYVIGSAERAAAFFKKFGGGKNRVRTALIIGGGTIGYYTAKSLLQIGIDVHLIERNPERAEELSDLLPDATIIIGDGTDKHKLLEQGLTRTDAVITVMGEDEENVMMALFASTQTDAKLIMKVEQEAFKDIIERLELQSAVFPDSMTADFIIQYVRAMQNTQGNNVETLYSILDDRAEALEFLVRSESKAIGVPLMDMDLKPGILIGCINRNGSVIIPGGRDSIQIGDTVIVITTHKGLRDLTDILK